MTITNNIPTSPCPSCKKQCACGCKSCVERHGQNEKTEIYDRVNDLTICPFCKQASHPDAWLDAEVAEMKENGTW
jgi:hypothetical protein